MKLRRHPANPLIAPSSLWWETRGTFNAAATLHDGKVHLLYRALGDDPLSRFGLAVSTDGVEFERSANPVFEGALDTEWERLGVEDPRVTVADGRYLITYVAASVYPMDHPMPPFSFGAPWRPRTCLATTIDFRTFDRMGVMLPDSDNKDVVLFPERINGRWAVLHREYPNIWLAYSDDLLHWDSHRVIMEPRPGMWDCNRIGAGAPPFRTELGWVEIYHGVDDARNYALGIALLDLDDPTRVIGRSPEPVLFPEEPYERNGLVPNVCFACGVVERGDDVLVYYGGADTCVCLATVARDELVSYLRATRR